MNMTQTAPTHLRILWQAHGGKGHSSWQPASLQERLEDWAKDLQRANFGATFTIEEGTPNAAELAWRAFPR